MLFERRNKINQTKKQTNNAREWHLDLILMGNITIKGVDLYPWFWGMIGANIFSAMDQSNQEVEACGRLHPLPKGVARISF